MPLALGFAFVLHCAALGCIQNIGEPSHLPIGTGAELDFNVRQYLLRHPVDGDPFGGRKLFDGEPWSSPLQQIQEDPVARLGMQLFYSTHLSGQGDVACVTCHVNSLGGGDARVLPLGPGGRPNSPDPVSIMRRFETRKSRVHCLSVRIYVAQI